MHKTFLRPKKKCQNELYMKEVKLEIHTILLKQCSYKEFIPKRNEYCIWDGQGGDLLKSNMHLLLFMLALMYHQKQ